MKEHKGKLILSSVLVLLPLVAGLLLWNRLPEQLPMHWNAAGEIDGWGSRLMGVCLLPLFLLVIHWVCVAACFIDPKNKEQNRKALGLVLWICPVVSLLAGFMTVSSGLGMALRVDKLVQIFLGVLFIVIGNYLPKCKQNYTIGIRVMWALEDEENWTATHRFASRIWVGCGVGVLLLAFLPWAEAGLWISVGMILLTALSSVLYSYIFYRKKHG
ncbi:MAG: SdpI family protein [Candidatus Limivicinus sp.]